MLAENVELTLKLLRVKRSASRGIAFTVMRAEDDEWLKDGGFLARSSGTENGAVRGDFSPSQHTKTKVPGDL